MPLNQSNLYCYVESLTRVFFPANCHVCYDILDLDEKGLCEPCLDKLCASLFSPLQTLCASKYRRISHAWSVFRYSDICQKLLTQLKYEQKPWIWDTFAPHYQDALERITAETHYDFILPIPTSFWKRLQREYSIPELMAETATKALGKRSHRDLVARKGKAASQTTLPREQRLLNPLGSFYFKNTPRIKGQSILILDDILTTGATAESVAFLLSQAGAKHIDLLTCARSEK